MTRLRSRLVEEERQRGCERERDRGLKSRFKSVANESHFHVVASPLWFNLFQNPYAFVPFKRVQRVTSNASNILIFSIQDGYSREINLEN